MSADITVLDKLNVIGHHTFLLMGLVLKEKQHMITHHPCLKTQLGWVGMLHLGLLYSNFV